MIHYFFKHCEFLFELQKNIGNKQINKNTLLKNIRRKNFDY